MPPLEYAYHSLELAKSTTGEKMGKMKIDSEIVFLLLFVLSLTVSFISIGEINMFLSHIWI